MADKKVFPNFYILGWYSTGSDAEESDMHIHKAVRLLFFNLFYFSKVHVFIRMTVCDVSICDYGE